VVHKGHEKYKARTLGTVIDKIAMS